MSYHSSYIRTDVTAVKFYENYILAGIGSSVKVFEKDTKLVFQVLLCLNGQKIYGFRPSSNGSRVLVFGGKQFTLLYRAPDDTNELFASSGKPVVCNDWLHSVVWIDCDTIAVLTAHNVVQRWNLTTQTLESQFCSPDNSILYSGLLLPLKQDVLMMAGTVFSEVILQVSGEDRPLHRLKGHKGVIFSISCYPEKHILVTTSDDRSVRIWGPKTPPQVTCLSTDYWRNAEIFCKYELYGHSARVMRSCITDDDIVSVGEDSQICFWDYNGDLKKKVTRHQNGGIWSIDADGKALVTGGGDCAVILHPLTTSDHNKSGVIDSIGKVKHVAFTARHNLFMINESSDLLYYDFENPNKNLKPIFEFGDARCQSLMSMSSCKQICAAGANSFITALVETVHRTNEEPAVFIKIGLDQMASSLHWAGNRHLVLGFNNGDIRVFTSSNSAVGGEHTTGLYAAFEVPTPSRRDMVVTAAAVDHTCTQFVIGDRSGNGAGSLRLYHTGTRHPIMTFNKTHGSHGLTSIMIKNNQVITTGRDRTIKYYTLTDAKLIHSTTKELEFPWVEKFLDREQNMICGFKEKMFVVFDLKSNCKLFEVECGGGHRSWDAVRCFQKVGESYEEAVKLVYLKNSIVNTIIVLLGSVVSTHIEKGSHSKEIMCLKTHPINDESALYISGGEDTTLRVSLMKENEFHDLVICKHLSSVKTIKLHLLNECQILLISAGGRAQICIKLIKYINNGDKINAKVEDLVNFMLKGTDRERKRNQSWKDMSVDFNPETRIMDIDSIEHNDKFTIFAGCSDASLRVFTYDAADRDKIKLIKESKYPTTCLLKTICIMFQKHNIVVTCSTRGEVAFWDPKEIDDTIVPFYTMNTNKSGINSVAYKEVSNRLLIVTGGDDNAIHLNILALADQTLSSMTLQSSFILDKHHSSEITGLCLVENFLLSTSIDQRITLFRWRLTDEIECSFVSQAFSDVADIQGMNVVSYSSSSIKFSLNRLMAGTVKAVTAPVTLGEGPHWDSAEQVLYFISIFDKSVHKYDPASGQITSAKLDGMPTFIIPVEGKKGHFVVGLNRKVVEVVWDGTPDAARVLRTVAEVDHDNPNNRLNDAKADPRGRLFAGTMGHEYEPGKFHLKKGSLYRISGSGAAVKLADNIDISNGLCWDVREKAFYYADSFEYVIRRYDYDIETGDISNPRQVFKCADYGIPGIVDGMTVDTDGNLWVANFDGNQVLKIDPRSSKLLQKVPIPALQVTSVTFGGPALDELYVTSASMNRGEEQKPPCGATFKITGLGVKGHKNVNVRLD